MSEVLLIGTHRRAHHDDPADIAFGIYAANDEATGTQAQLSIETPPPGWIAAHPHRPMVYAVNEVKSIDGMPGGSVSAFAVANGDLRLVGSWPTPPMPCHCAVDATGRVLLVATFGGGSVHVFPLDVDGAPLGEAGSHHHTGSSVHPRRQTAPHAHAVAIDPANRFVLVPDLGTDRLLVYELDPAAAALVPRPELTAVLPPGSGPRHVAFGQGGSTVYLVNEMSATIAVFAFSDGRLLLEQMLDILPEGFAGLRSGAAVVIAPSGDFLYATTRSHGTSGMPPAPGLDTIVWFAIEPGSGHLRLAGRIPSGGEIPRAALLSRDGTRLLIAHQASGTVVGFALDERNGTPTRTGSDIMVPVPVCLCWAPPATA